MAPGRRTPLAPPGASRTPAATSILTLAALALLVLAASVAPMPARGQSNDDAAVDLVDPVPANLYTQVPDDELAWWPDGRQNEVYPVLVDDPDLYTIDDGGKKTISWNVALQTCRLFGANVATLDQLQNAFEQGAAWCYCGVLGTLDDSSFAYPVQTPSQGCGSEPGVHQCDTLHDRNLATCFGIKPATAVVEVRAPKTTLYAFAGGRWSQYCDKEGAAGCPSSVQSVAEDGKVASHTISRLRFAVPRPVPYQGDTRMPKTVLAKGRFISNDADQLVAMTKVGNYTKDNNCFSFDYELAGFIDPSVSNATFPGWSLRPCLAGRSRWYESPFDLAAGDLDRAMDHKGELHDELVIVHEEGNASLEPPGVVRLHVLDYAANPTDPVETVHTLPSDDAHAYDRLGYRKDGKGEVYPGVLLAETFDAGGTGAKLIATVHSSNQLSGRSGYVVNVLAYTPPSGEGHTGTITLIGDQTFSISSPSGRDFPSSASLAAGDFDGDGDEELGLLYTDHGGAHLVVLTAVPGEGVEVLSHEWTDASLSTATIPTAKLIAGLFSFEPEKGFDLGRRQLALGTWSAETRTISLKVLLLDGAFNVGATDLSPHPSTVIVDFGFAAGSFAGVSSESGDQSPSPIWSIALGSLYQPEVTPKYQVQFIDPVADRVTDTVQQKWLATEQPALLAFDQDGDSLYLGAPVTFQADRAQQLLSTLEQPPQHLDYLPNEPGANGVGLLDVSRDPAFRLTFSETVDSKLASDLSSTGSWNIGASGKASASFTITEKIPFIEKGTLKSTLTPFIEGAYSHSSTSSAGNRSSVKVEMSESPVDDDALYLTMQRYEIWRYRLYGAQTDDPSAPYAYYEVLKPIGLVTNGWFAGLTSDPYQPLHENGNILSYPDIYKNDPGSPPDLGSWSPTALPSDCSQPAPPDTSYTTPLTGATARVLQVGGVQSTLKVALSKSNTCSGKRQSKYSLKGGGDFRAVLTLTEKEVVAKETERGTVDVHADSDSSWGDLSSWNVTTEESENLAITTVASADSSFDYELAPSLYFADDGNLRVRFYASTPEQTQSWWATTYGLPDPALNLPRKYIAPNRKDWQPSTSMDALRIRGFYLRDADPSAIDSSNGLGPLLASVPEQGDKVQVEVVVYNFSVEQGVTSLPVRFDIADYDARTDTVSNRRVLGAVTAQFTDEHATPDGRVLSKTFPPRGVGRAVYTLDTSTLPNVAEVSDYVMYAVLNPGGDSPAEETHPWRSPDVTVMVFTQGRENVGATLELAITDQDGKALDTVKATSSGDIAQDVKALAAAFNGSDVARTYGIEAIDYLPGEADDPSAQLVLAAAGNARLPSPSEFRATLAFDEAVAGVTELHVVPSVSGPGNGTMTASNLAPGQNNEGYGFFAVAGSESQPASAVALEATTLAAADLSGRIVDGRASGAVGRRLRLRVCAHADGTFRGIVDVPVFLGDPAEGKGLAIKRLHGVDRDGSCAWFDWTPPAPGQHTIHALLPRTATTAQATVSDSLTIQVQ